MQNHYITIACLYAYIIRPTPVGFKVMERQAVTGIFENRRLRLQVIQIQDLIILRLVEQLLQLQRHIGRKMRKRVEQKVEKHLPLGPRSVQQLLPLKVVQKGLGQMRLSRNEVVPVIQTISNYPKGGESLPGMYSSLSSARRSWATPSSSILGSTSWLSIFSNLWRPVRRV